MYKNNLGTGSMKLGAVLALIGGVIILFPEAGWTPHPLPWPPSEATRPIAGWAIFGYPFLALGVLLLVGGALVYAVNAALERQSGQS